MVWAEHSRVSDLFHIYRDGTHFPYEITLTRDDVETGDVGQKYILYVSASPKPVTESSSMYHSHQTIPSLLVHVSDLQTSLVTPTSSPHGRSSIPFHTEHRSFLTFTYLGAPTLTTPTRLCHLAAPTHTLTHSLNGILIRTRTHAVPPHKQLFESNAKPHLYWFAAKFWRKKRDNKPSCYRPTTCSGLKAEHYRLFTSFFRKKTGVEWCDRVVEAGTGRKGLFRYMPPVSEFASLILTFPSFTHSSLFKSLLSVRMENEC